MAKLAPKNRSEFPQLSNTAHGRYLPPSLDDVLRELREVVARVDALERQAATRGPRDVSGLGRQIAASTHGLAFRTAHLFAHAKVDPDLSAAFDTTWIASAEELGCWLRDRIGTRDGICIERRGRRWRVTSDT